MQYGSISSQYYITFMVPDRSVIGILSDDILIRLIGIQMLGQTWKVEGLFSSALDCFKKKWIQS